VNVLKGDDCLIALDGELGVSWCLGFALRLCHFAVIIPQKFNYG